MSPTWRKIPLAEQLKRSSHSLCIVHDKAYLFGGEIQPRKPVDNRLHVVDLQSGEYEAVEGTGEMPEARVGHTGVVSGSDIYIFGGMTPLTPSLHIFSTTDSSWRTVPAAANGPVARSYHASAASPTHIFVHAGCGDASTGRLKDTWAFDIASEQWIQLAEGPGDVRGGTALCYAPNGKAQGLWRFGGFNGKTEIGGQIDHLSLPGSDASSHALTEAQWTTHTFGETQGHGRDAATDTGLHVTAEDASVPGARSVCGIHPDAKTGRLITMFGEGKPSPTGGHDAAGNFWGDVWAFDPATKQWEAVKPAAAEEGRSDAAGGGGGGPGERGWFASDAAEREGIVVWGGIDKDNERLGDGWVLSS